MKTSRRWKALGGALLVAAGLLAVYSVTAERPPVLQAAGGPSSTAMAPTAVAVSQASQTMKREPLAARFEDATRQEFERVNAGAERGDVRAQRRLAELYEKCFSVNVRRASYLEGIESMAGQHSDPDAGQQMRLIGQRVFAQCGGVDGGQFIPLDAMLLWREQAARGGDLASQLWLRRQRSVTSPLTAEEYAGLAAQVSASGDATAMAYLGDLAGTAGGLKAPDVDPHISGLAWQIAACQQGRACAAGSELMDVMCFSLGACTETDATVVLRLMAADRQAALDAEIARILSRVDKMRQHTR
ncbi:hypothetical protein [Stenotrophomonas sp. Ker107b]